MTNNNRLMDGVSGLTDDELQALLSDQDVESTSSNEGFVFIDLDLFDLEKDVKSEDGYNPSCGRRESVNSMKARAEADAATLDAIMAGVIPF